MRLKSNADYEATKENAQKRFKRIEYSRESDLTGNLLLGRLLNFPNVSVINLSPKNNIQLSYTDHESLIKCIKDEFENLLITKSNSKLLLIVTSQTRTSTDNEIDSLMVTRQKYQDKLEELLHEIDENSPFLNIRKHNQEVKQQCQDIHLKIDAIDDELSELGESRLIIARGSVWSYAENTFINPHTKGMDLTPKRKRPPFMKTNYG